MLHYHILHPLVDQRHAEFDRLELFISAFCQTDGLVMKRFSWWSHVRFSGVTRTPGGCNVVWQRRACVRCTLTRKGWTAGQRLIIYTDTYFGTMFHLSPLGFFFGFFFYNCVKATKPPHESNEQSPSFKAAKNQKLSLFIAVFFLIQTEHWHALIRGGVRRRKRRKVLPFDTGFDHCTLPPSYLLPCCLSLKYTWSEFVALYLRDLSEMRQCQ